MNEPGKSDGPVVPTKPPNKAVAAEAVEERGPAKGNTAITAPTGRSAGQAVSHGLDRVREATQRDRKTRFTALLHHIDTNRLRAAYRALSPRAARGVDGVTWAAYGEDLESHLQNLLTRLHRGSYRAQPTRRAYIPKADGRQRPLGIAALEDKIVQRAVVEVMNAIYEADFLGFSYGCRPGRGPHDALDALASGILGQKLSWVLDADLRDFFATLDHGWLMRFLEHRIGDRRILRLIQKWLRAGVIDKGNWSESREGVPQGASVSPLLANVYLHYVFDQWAHQWRKRHAKGDVVIVRYLDDFTVGFQHRGDAERFREGLHERLARFGLELHPGKTRLIEFGRFAAANRQRRGQGKPETFDFLGFTHICARSSNGKFFLKRITMRKRMRSKLRQVKAQLQRNRHRPIPEQGRWLGAVMRGHFAYYAVPTNGRAICSFQHQVRRYWFRALLRRSQKHRLNWTRMHRLSQRWLPTARILHPYPNVRFAART